MIAFEVSVNGDKKCTAGVGAKDGLNVIISGPRLPDLHVGGLSGEEHLRWLKPGFELKVGDEVTVRVVETDVVDEPVDRHVSQTRAQNEQKIIDFLQKARALLPVPIRASKSANLQILDERMAQNHFMGAMDVLEKLGEESSASGEFWKELSNAAHEQTAYEDRDRYTKKRRAMKSEAKTEQE